MEHDEHLRRKLAKSKENTEVKPRPRSVSALPPSIFNKQAYFKRTSFDPKPTTPQRDASLALLKKSKLWGEFERRIYHHLTTDQRINEEIQQEFKFLVIDKERLLQIKRKVDIRELSNTLQQASKMCVEELWDKYLRPGCEKDPKKTEQIDFIIQAILNEFTASNIDDNKNIMLSDSKIKLDINYLPKDFINQKDEENYTDKLSEFRGIIRQAQLKRLEVKPKSAQDNKNESIPRYAVPKKGSFISAEYLATEFPKSIGLEEKDLKNILPIIFELVRAIQKENKSSLIATLKETELLYFNEDHVPGLFAHIKIKLRPIVKTSYGDNKKLMSDIDKMIKNNRSEAEKFIGIALNNWLKEALKLQNEKAAAESKSNEPLESVGEIVIGEEPEKKDTGPKP